MVLRLHPSAAMGLILCIHYCINGIPTLLYPLFTYVVRSTFILPDVAHHKITINIAQNKYLESYAY